ncbi:TetR/AcrR family transcriptional regulator [Paenibacillus sp. J2TS4]|uniref:TetR/AcrR family transcriptional regulator n=1 Tax=Paenibacillus sp. J2TS4 TaxID=2807194 RepID=UPI001B22F22B|nr:TetR/AcrR family transcriptional regulator [Paenibacillus sp. J2TS4]GIP31857.1 putative HTH-type transcriptional regulator YdgC [Paenibacillus sp. J2TS4]
MKPGTKGRESRNRLLEAAISLIAERGYRDTKVSDIVKKAELTQAAFYLYFSGKEALFEEISQLFYSRVNKYLQAAVLETELPLKEAPERIRGNLEGLFSFFGEHPELTKIFLTEEKNSEAVEKLIHQTIVSNLMKNQASGFIRNDLSAEMIADCILGMFVQVILQAILVKRRDPKQVAHEFTRVLLFGLIHPSYSTGGAAP